MWTDLLMWVNSRVYLRDEEGQTAIEYALVVAGVAIVLVGFLAAGGSDVFTAFWDKVRDAMGIA